MSNNPYIFHNTNVWVKIFFVYHQHLGVILFSDIWTQLIYCHWMVLQHVFQAWIAIDGIILVSALLGWLISLALLVYNSSYACRKCCLHFGFQCCCLLQQVSTTLIFFMHVCQESWVLTKEVLLLVSLGALSLIMDGWMVGWMDNISSFCL